MKKEVVILGVLFAAMMVFVLVKMVSVVFI